MHKKILRAIACVTVCFIAFSFGNLFAVDGNANWIVANQPHLPAIIIDSSGAISPVNMPIKKIGDVYYLTENISYYRFVVSRNNTILDGQGFTLLGNMSTDAIGITPTADNITIRNMILTSFRVGIEVGRSWGGNVAQGPGICITNNTICDCYVGVYIVYDSNNFVVGNSFENNTHSGIWVREGYSNKITQNQITNNLRGIYIETTNNNIFWQNEINSNEYGVYFYRDSFNNTFYLNNFSNNSNQTYSERGPPYSQKGLLNNWDNGVVGNYWSGYQIRYPNAVEVGSSGVGNTVYVIDQNNADHYPLMQQVDIPKIPVEVSSPPPESSPTPESPSESTFPTAYAAVVSAVAVCAVAVCVGMAVFLKNRRR